METNGSFSCHVLIASDNVTATASYTNHIYGFQPKYIQLDTIISIQIDNKGESIYSGNNYRGMTMNSS